jgi:hypothetical protein
MQIHPLQRNAITENVTLLSGITPIKVVKLRKRTTRKGRGKFFQRLHINTPFGLTCVS